MTTRSQPHPGISTVIEIIGLGFCTASYTWLPNITNPLHKGVGGSHQFLTIIGLTLTAMTFVVGLLGGVFRSKQLLAIKSYLSTIATPLEVLIGTLYWSLHTIDKSLVTPPGHALPLIPNLGSHAIPAITLTLDMLAGNVWSIDVLSALILDSAFFFTYWAWLEYCYSFNGWFPYPLLIHLNIWQKFLHTIGAAVLMVGYTLALKSAHERISKSDPEKDGLRQEIGVTDTT